MDQIRKFFRFLRKQHFWLIVPVLIILMTAAWFSASSQAIKTFQDGASTIKQNFDTMSGVARLSPHPNERFDEGMSQLIKQRARDVAAAWEVQYAKQVDTMKWSPKLAEEAPDFVAAVDVLRPIEAVGKVSLPPWMLDTYRDFIVKEELKRLAEIIGSTWIVAEADFSAMPGAAAGGAGGYGGYGGYGGEGGIGPPSGGGDEAAAAPGAYGGYGGGGYGGYGGYGGGSGGYGSYDLEDNEGIVVRWNPENQQQIQATSFGWSLRSPGQPTVKEMLYSQEDVWVLDSLMQVIKMTNGDARHYSQAVIKEIQSIEIGKLVGGPKGKVSKVEAPPTGEEEELEDDGFGISTGAGDGYGDPYGDYAAGLAPEYGDESAGGFTVDPAEGRYVDENYQPIPAEDLRTNAESSDLKVIAVAKRMPVRMRVRMDSRRIPDLLAACANAPLTFEVHQLRLNPQATDEGTFGAMGMGGSVGYGGYGAGGGDEAGGAAAGYGGYGASSDGGYGGYGGGGGGYGGYGGGGGGYGGYGGGGGYGQDGGGYLDDEDRVTESFEKVIELFGVIHIYNPVDKVKLELESADETAEATEVAAADVPRG